MAGLLLGLFLLASPAVAPDPPGWIRIDAADAGFSASFPATPARVDAPLAMPEGRSMRTRTFVLDRPDVRWAVGVMEPEGSMTPEEIARLPEGLVASMKGVVRKTTVQRDGHAGYELEVRSARGRLQGLYLAADGRVYQVLVVAKGDQDLPRETRAFLDGFRIVPVTRSTPLAAIPFSDWKEFRFEGPSFAARFPSAPTDVPGQATPGGIRTRRISAEQRGTNYTILVVPVSGIEALGREYVDAMAIELDEKMAAKDTSAKITLGPPSKVSGYPSRDLAVRLDEQSMFIRFVATPQFVFQVGEIATGGQEASSFVASFRVME